MKKVVLCPNPYRDINLKLTLEAAGILKSVGIETVISPLFRTPDDGVPYDVETVPFSTAVKDADLVMTFGGDGTFLHLARNVAPHKIPIVGVNMGTLGYMADLEARDIIRIKELASKPLNLESRMMLDIRVFRGERQIYTGLALNDAVISKGAVAHTIKLQISLANTSLNQISGDGVVVASPTGSTAYSLATGGPIVEPTARNIIISPICAHALISGSFVLSSDHSVTVQSVGNGNKQVFLSVDGGKAFSLKGGDRVQIRKSVHSTQVARMTDYNFYELLLRKMSAKKGDK